MFLNKPDVDNLKDYPAEIARQQALLTEENLSPEKKTNIEKRIKLLEQERDGIRNRREKIVGNREKSLQHSLEELLASLKDAADERLYESNESPAKKLIDIEIALINDDDQWPERKLDKLIKYYNDELEKERIRHINYQDKLKWLKDARDNRYLGAAEKFCKESPRYPELTEVIGKLNQQRDKLSKQLDIRDTINATSGLSISALDENSTGDVITYISFLREEFKGGKLPEGDEEHYKDLERRYIRNALSDASRKFAEATNISPIEWGQVMIKPFNPLSELNKVKRDIAYALWFIDPEDFYQRNFAFNLPNRISIEPQYATEKDRDTLQKSIDAVKSALSDVAQAIETYKGVQTAPWSDLYRLYERYPFLPLLSAIQDRESRELDGFKREANILCKKSLDVLDSNSVITLIQQIRDSGIHKATQEAPSLTKIPQMFSRYEQQIISLDGYSKQLETLLELKGYFDNFITEHTALVDRLDQQINVAKEYPAALETSKKLVVLEKELKEKLKPEGYEYHKEFTGKFYEHIKDLRTKLYGMLGAKDVLDALSKLYANFATLLDDNANDPSFALKPWQDLLGQIPNRFSNPPEKQPDQDIPDPEQRCHLIYLHAVIRVNWLTALTKPYELTPTGQNSERVTLLFEAQTASLGIPKTGPGSYTAAEWFPDSKQLHADLIGLLTNVQQALVDTRKRLSAEQKIQTCRASYQALISHSNYLERDYRAAINLISVTSLSEEDKQILREEVLENWKKSLAIYLTDKLDSDKIALEITQIFLIDRDIQDLNEQKYPIPYSLEERFKTQVAPFIHTHYSDLHQNYEGRQHVNGFFKLPLEKPEDYEAWQKWITYLSPEPSPILSQEIECYKELCALKVEKDSDTSYENQADLVTGLYQSLTSSKNTDSSFAYPIALKSDALMAYWTTQLWQGYLKDTPETPISGQLKALHKNLSENTEIGKRADARLVTTEGWVLRLNAINDFMNSKNLGYGTALSKLDDLDAKLDITLDANTPIWLVYRVKEMHDFSTNLKNQILNRLSTRAIDLIQELRNGQMMAEGSLFEALENGLLLDKLGQKTLLEATQTYLARNIDYQKIITVHLQGKSDEIITVKLGDRLTDAVEAIRQLVERINTIVAALKSQNNKLLQNLHQELEKIQATTTARSSNLFQAQTAYEEARKALFDSLQLSIKDSPNPNVWNFNAITPNRTKAVTHEAQACVSTTRAANDSQIQRLVKLVDPLINLKKDVITKREQVFDTDHLENYNVKPKERYQKTIADLITPLEKAVDAINRLIQDEDVSGISIFEGKTPTLSVLKIPDILFRKQVPDTYRIILDGERITKLNGFENHKTILEKLQERAGHYQTWGENFKIQKDTLHAASINIPRWVEHIKRIKAVFPNREWQPSYTICSSDLSDLYSTGYKSFQEEPQHIDSLTVEAILTQYRNTITHGQGIIKTDGVPPDLELWVIEFLRELDNGASDDYVNPQQKLDTLLTRCVEDVNRQMKTLADLKSDFLRLVEYNEEAKKNQKSYEMIDGTQTGWSFFGWGNKTSINRRTEIVECKKIRTVLNCLPNPNQRAQ